MTGRTFGTLTYAAPDSGAGSGQWELTAEPDVTIRAKRHFPGAVQSRSGVVQLTDSDEICRDLDWLMQRWPLTITASDKRRLRRRARAHALREQQVTDILNGTHLVPAGAGGDHWSPALPLRDYQQTAHDLIVTTSGTLVADDLGLGKTFVGLSLLADPQHRPALAVTLTALPPQWEREAHRLFPGIRTHVLSKGSPYDVRDADGQQPDLLITNYRKLAGWADHLAGNVPTVVFDEVQELRRSDSDKYAAAERIAHQARTVVGLSATPVWNYGGEMHSIMNIVAPGELGTAGEFAREWCNTYGLDRKTRVREPEALAQRLKSSGRLIRRTRQDVGITLPPIRTVEQLVPADLSVINEAEVSAAEVARLILSDTAHHRDRWAAAGDLDWQMRQATGIAKAPYVAAFIDVLLQSEERVMVYAWHRQVHELLRTALARYNPVLYTGSESVQQKEKAVAAFTEGDSRVLIMSLRAGAGLDGLQHHANVCVFAELDWAHGVHVQCIGRLGRPGQCQPTLAYFCVCDSGSDPIMLDVVNVKALESSRLFDPSDDVGDAPVVDTSEHLRKLASAILTRQSRKAS